MPEKIAKFMRISKFPDKDKCVVQQEVRTTKRFGKAKPHVA